MTASSEGRDEDLPARLRLPVLAMLLGFVAVYGLVVHGYLSMNMFWGPRGWSASFALASNLLVVGAIWGVSRLRPSKPGTLVLLLLLAFAALLPFGAGSQLLKILHARNFVGLWHWKTLGLLAANLLIFAGAIWGLWRLRPWQALKDPGEPVSPTTRRTNRLLGLSCVVGILLVVALAIGTRGNSTNEIWSNSLNLSPVVAIVAIAIWLLGLALSWWWYISADEHDRRANDVGFLAGGGLFIAVTPIWWIAARASLLPPPDAMVLWFATVVVMGTGYFWHRNR